MGALIALGHHEKYDGTGYPNGLVADHIPLCARIVAVADVFDALTSARPYKPAWPAERAFQYLAAQRGRHFDPRLADAFVSLRNEIMEIRSEWQDPGQAAVSS
jgi:putative two-component system response regulator